MLVALAKRDYSLTFPRFVVYFRCRHEVGAKAYREDRHPTGLKARGVAFLFSPEVKDV
jgi:hypothetical protein